MDVAITGMAIRFPGANTLAEFAENLASGADHVREISPRRRKATGLPLHDPFQLLGYLEDIDLFEPAFFGISKAEAKNMAPQQRLLMEVAFEAFENAGYNYERFNGSNTAVYIGDTQIQYYELARQVEPTLYTGNMNSIIASRIARFFNLRGKALMVDTTCSSSLVALHLACRDLAVGECEQALVGAVSLNLFPNKKTTTDHLGILSPDGKAKTFSAQANGTSAGEGAACILLKPLRRALADGDIIHAVIKGSAVNQDANLSGSLTAPSSTAQAEVLVQAWKNAGIDPETIGFIEAHGTGTRLGDPIEIEGITRAFRQYTGRKKFCAVSSVKANIGHTDCVAGLAGLIKTVLSFRCERLFPAVHFTTPNPFIDFDNAPVFVADRAMPWKRNGTPRLAGVSSFGLTGTNCHVVVEEAPPVAKEPTAPAGDGHLIVLSAQTPASLEAGRLALADHLDSHSGLSLADIAYTLAAGRKHFDCRYATVCSSVAELKDMLRSASSTMQPTTTGRQRDMVLVLSDWQSADDAIIGSFNTIPFFHAQHRRLMDLAGPQSELPACRQAAFQYSFCKLLQHIGMPVDAAAGDNIGKLVLQAVNGSISPEEMVKQCAICEKTGKADFEERCWNLLQRFNRESVLFLEAGPVQGITKKLQLWKAGDSRYEVMGIPTDTHPLQGWLQQVYLAGITPDFSPLIGGKRIELPAYRFSRQRYWLEEEYHFDKVNAWSHTLQWVEDNTEKKQPLPAGRNLLLVTALQNPFVRELRQALSAHGGTNYMVVLATRFCKADQQTYEIRADKEADYITVAADLRQRNVRIDGIVFVTGAGFYDGPLTGHLQNDLKYGVYAHFHICKAFNHVLDTKGNRLALLTANTFNVLPGDRSSPVQAMHTGLLKALQSDHPWLRVHSVDAEQYDAEAIRQLLFEMDQDEGICYCAYRGGKRYVQQLQKITADPAHDLATLLPEQGTFIVTGGIGGIGLALCQSILRRQPATLIIIGRTPLPWKPAWKKMVADPSHHQPETRRIEALLQLEKMGGRIEYHAADLGNEQAVRAVFENINRRYAKIDGIIHAAGVPIEHIPFEQLSFHDFRELLTAKVAGTVLLDMLAKETDPAFFVMFSSLNALVPRRNSTAYTVANVFEDAFAASGGTAKQCRYLSINWPGWQLGEPAVERSGPSPLAVADGLGAFYLALQDNRSNISILHTPLPGFTANPFFLYQAPVVADHTASSGVQYQLSSTAEKMMSIWREVLKSDTVGPDDDFFEVGGHSLIGIQVVNRIEKELGVAIEFEVFFDHCTVIRLSEYIDQLLVEGTAAASQPILPVEEQEYYEVSYAQKRLWVLDQLIDDSVYNIPTTYILNGQLNRKALEEAFAALIRRHETLRTVLITVDGIPKQKILDADILAFQVKYFDLRPYADRYERAAGLVEEVVKLRFDLYKGPIIVARLIALEDDRHLFSFSLHHIISDGWSGGIITRELIRFYNEYKTRGIISALPLSIQYKDYTNWQRMLLQSEAFETHRRYWLDQFAGEIPVLNLPPDLPRPAVQTFRGKTIECTIDDGLTAQIRKLAAEHDATSFMILFTALNVLLYRYVGQKDIIIGTPITERAHYDLEDQVGFYVNNLPLKTRVDEHETVTGLLEQVKKVIGNANKHKDYPLELLINELNITRDTSRSALFNVVIGYQNTAGPEEALAMDGIEVEDYPLETDISKFDITFDFYESENDITLKLVFNNALYTEPYITRAGMHLCAILASFARLPLQPLSLLQMLHGEEERQLLGVFNNTKRPWPQQKTLTELFEERALMLARKSALVYLHERVTYGELYERCNRLAAYMQQQGVRAGSRIGLLSRRQPDMIVAMLAILRAGCSYVPFNTGYPPRRMQYIAQDAGITHLVYTDAALLEISGLATQVACIAVCDAMDLPAAPQPVKSTPQDCAYIMYTSGTTGNPKGIAVSHRNIVKLIYDEGPIRVQPGDRMLQWSNYSFDGSTWEIYGALLWGGELHLIKDEWASDVYELARVMQEQQITTCFITTALFNSFADLAPQAFAAMRKILFGGEMVSPKHVRKSVSVTGKGKIVHVYGPTETTVYATGYPVDDVGEDDLIPIGRPLCNTTCYVLDGNRQLLPPGVPGELYIGGAGVSMGYVTEEARSAGSFLADPFASDPQAMMYRTGDLVRWLPDGNIEFLGRKDDQVKIRGYRIEPGEIENALLTYPGMQQAVVVVADKGDKMLIAYYTAEQPVPAETLRHFLDNMLPSFLVPARFIALETMPLSANGKIDRRLLPEPDAAAGETTSNRVTPRNETERCIAAIWQEILGVDEVGVGENFFSIGGHSLNALKVITEMHKRLQVKPSLKELFTHPTIAELAELVKALQKTGYTHIAAVEEQQYYNVSYAQRGLWIQHQFTEQTAAFNISAAYIFEGELFPALLEEAFAQLMQRHEILRTVFIEIEGEPKQRVIPAEACRFTIHLADLRGNGAPDRVISEMAEREALEPFRLHEFPLLRAQLLHVAEARYVFLFTIHHIIADGWSLQVLVHEVVSTYNALRSGAPAQQPRLTGQYKDFMVWQRHLPEWQQAANESYWQQQMEKDVPSLVLPYDFPRPPVKTFNSDAIRVPFRKEHYEHILQYCLENELTPYAFFVASVDILLYAYSGQPDICVGMADSGRHHGDLQNQLGLYLNMLVLRQRLDPAQSLLEICIQSKKTILAALEHKDYPFELLTEKFSTQRDISKTPFFDVEVAFTNFNRVMGNETQVLDGVNVSLLDMEVKTGGKFDLDFIFIQEGEEVDLLLFFNTDLFKRKTAERMVEDLQGVMRQIIDMPEIPLGSVQPPAWQLKEPEAGSAHRDLRTFRRERLKKYLH